MLSLKRFNQPLLYIAAALGVGLLLGVASILLSPLWVLAGLAALGFFFVLLKRPEIGLLGYLIITSTIFDENSLPRIPIGVGRLLLTDIILMALFGLVMIRLLVEPDFKFVRTPLDLPLFAFVGIALLATVLAILQSSLTLNKSLGEVRVILGYMTFFIVTNLVRNKVHLKTLVNGIVILAAIVAVAMIVQFLLGNSVHLLPGRIETLANQDTKYSGITRVLPPGQSLVFLTFIYLVILLVFDKQRAKSVMRFLQTAVLGLAVILTFNRNFWAGIGIALTLLVILTRSSERKRLVAWFVVALLLGSLIITIIQTGPETKVGRLIQGFESRISTLFNVKTLSEKSLQFRYIENEYALPQIALHPFLGLGLGSFYRQWDDRLDWEKYDGRDYIHNGHLWVILKTGFLGYGCFLLFSVLFIWRGFRYFTIIPANDQRAVFLAFTLAYLGIFAMAIVNPVFTQQYWAPALGIIMGTNEVMLRLSQDKSLESPVLEKSN